MGPVIIGIAEKIAGIMAFNVSHIVFIAHTEYGKQVRSDQYFKHQLCSDFRNRLRGKNILVLEMKSH